MQWGFLSGANTRIRTGDLILTKDVLCRLSHISKLLTIIYYIIINLFCQGKIEIKQVILNCVFANGQIACSYSRYARLYCSFRYGCYNGATTDVYEHTAVEMQLNQNKMTNAEQIAMLFGLSPDVLSGRADDRTYINSIRTAVLPVVSAFEMALNRALLLEKEKHSKYFIIDTSELLKADILTRYQAYQIGLAANFLQPDEIRFKENLAPLGLDFIKLGLNDVLYDPKTKQIYTPNTDSHAKIDDAGLQSGDEGDIITEKRQKSGKGRGGNPYHAANGKFTNAPGGKTREKIKEIKVNDDGTVTTVSEVLPKTKYAPSPQRNHKGIQVSQNRYGKLCSAFKERYPDATKGSKGVIYDDKYAYKAEADDKGGIIITHKRILK